MLNNKVDLILNLIENIGKDKVLNLLNKYPKLKESVWNKKITSLYKGLKSDTEIENIKVLVTLKIISSILITVIISLFMAVAIFYANETENPGEFQRGAVAPFNTKVKSEDLKAIFKIDEDTLEKSYKIDIPKKAGTDEEKAKEVLDSITSYKIKGNNKSLYEIKEKLNLVYENKYDAKIRYEASDIDIDSNTGEIIRRPKGMLDKKINLKVYVSYNEICLDKTFKCKILESDYSENQMKVLEAITLVDEALENNKICNIKDDEYTLIDKVGDVDVSWYYDIDKKDSKKNNYYTCIGIMMLIGFLIAYNSYMKIELTEKARTEEIEINFESFLSKYILIINAGFTPYVAMQYIKSNDSDKNELYKEIDIICSKLDTGIPLNDALLSFSSRAKSKEIKRFVASLIYNIKRGDREFSKSLKKELEEANKYKNTLMQIKAKENNIKMMLPIMMIFIAIMIIVIYPAISSMKM